MKKTLSLLILAFAWILSPQETLAQQKGDPMLQVPVAMASYPFRNHWNDGAEPTLDILQPLGFTEFEDGAPQGVSPEDFKKMLNDRGISIPTTGTGFEQLEKDPQAVADR